MFAEEQNPTTAVAGRRLSDQQAVAQFRQVVSRVEPVAERFCKQETADRENFDCDIQIVVDTSMEGRNAYQTYNDAGKPVVGFTIPMIADARNPDELAFVLGHEMGHHIGQHSHKQQQQAVAGALILGALTAYGQASATAANPYRYTGNDQRDMQNSIELGAGVGQMAYSQTYELESDVIGTAITKAAGYDPVKGARFFARPEGKRTANGRLSFWGTHPPDEKRLATVLATIEGIEVSGGISRR
ncbi:Peptidase family M48 [Citreimonas salinaria]|uniref:Peptidase family M48 n=2 Tax=Citreimonas salinaria TaxID=321339 RepID=A0A1H3MIY0_9RHOB|nr:Peptidase family M48 [Citreimonas salinaria]